MDPALPHSVIVFVVMVSGVVSFGITEVLRRGMRGYQKRHRTAKGDPWYWQALIRLIALVVGCFVGFVYQQTPPAALLGLCGGAMSAAIVKVARAKLARLAK